MAVSFACDFQEATMIKSRICSDAVMKTALHVLCGCIIGVRLDAVADRSPSLMGGAAGKSD
jgi:hypothetical protein